MTAVWVTIAVLAVITFWFKAAGPLAVGGRDLSERVKGVIKLAAPALLSALVVYETFGVEDPGIEVDARLVGVAGAAVAVALKAPVLVVVGVAAVLAAGTRAIGLAG